MRIRFKNKTKLFAFLIKSKDFKILKTEKKKIKLIESQINKINLLQN